MDPEEPPEWEPRLIDEAIRVATERHEREKQRAHRRALQLAREQAYHRLAVAIDRPSPSPRGAGQLSLFVITPTLFDEEQ